jgi:hypothetical protein
MVDIDPEASTRYNLTIYMLGAVVGIVVLVMGLGAFNIPVPDFVQGVVLMGFMTMLRDAYLSYFKAREDIQAARIEGQKVQAEREDGCTES